MSNLIKNYLEFLLLPLIGFSRYAFDSDKFIKSCLTFKGDIVLVFEDSNTGVAYKQSPNFRFSFTSNSEFYVVFTPPAVFKEDLIKIAESEFYDLSERAIQTIIKLSDLPYKDKTASGGLYTDPILRELESEGNVNRFQPLDLFDDFIDIESST